MGKYVEYSFLCSVTSDGEVTLPNSEAWKSRFKREFPSAYVTVTISDFRNTRSLRQNRYFYGVIIPTIKKFLYETFGENLTPVETKIWIVQNILEKRPKIVLINDVETVILQDLELSKLDTKEFSEVVDLIILKASEMGCDIPIPSGSNHLNEIIQ